MDQSKLVSLLTELTGSLLPTSGAASNDIASLQRELAKSFLNDTDDIRARPFPYENLDEFTTEDLESNMVNYIERLAAEASSGVEADAPFVKIFRREVPVISSQIPGSVPAWARGALIEKTLGPFLNKDGRRFWFDFFSLVKMLPVFIGAEATPSLLIPLRIQILRGAKTAFTIQAGSVWIRSNRIVPAVAANLYTGLSIKGGEIQFSHPVVREAGKISVPAQVNVSLRLELAQPEVTDVSPGHYGIDVKNAKLQLPAVFAMQLSAAASNIMEAGSASWDLYGSPAAFTFFAAAPPHYETTLNRILVPFSASETTFTVRNCGSPFFQLSGEAPLKQSAWALTAATIDVNNPPVAAGIGAMVIRCDKGLRASWTGLKDLNLRNTASVNFGKPWIMLEPGRIGITDTETSNIAGRQLYKLWKDEESGRYATLSLDFNKVFPLIYNSYQKGDESLFTVTNSKGNLDRPVKVDGTPFLLESKNTLYLLAVNQAQQLVYLYDNDLLTEDNIPGIPPFPVKTSAIALRNALLTVSPFAAFGLFGELLNDDSFEKAIFIGTHGMISYLPTLPDPYAANVGIFRRGITRQYSDDERFTLSQVSALLVTMVGWPASPADPENARPVLSFHFAQNPQAATSQRLAVEGSSGDSNVQPHTLLQSPPPELDITAADAIENREFAERFAQQAKQLTDYHRQSQARVIDILPQANDYFSLLDVSTNADLMGISFGKMDDDFIFRRTHQSPPAIPQGASPLQVKGMDVVSYGKFVHAFTTPLISWEPVINISIPDTSADPDAGFLFFPNDGGATRIFSTSIEQVELAPLPVTGYIVDNAKNRPELPAWSIFTLPFGIRALGIFYKDSAFYPANNGKGVKVDLNAPVFADGLQGGLQLKITGAQHPRQGKSFEGLSYQLPNLVTVTGTATGKSILGASVTDIYNKEFGGSVSQRGVPLERLDISGYGASIFSNWLNPDAAFARTSQARFDVFKGRTAHEVIQVKSIIYPWGIHVVRTITIYRTGSGYVNRHDSGWIAESDGVYDFSNNVYPSLGSPTTVKIPGPYSFHTGVVRGVFEIKNIKENELAQFIRQMPVNKNENYIDEKTGVLTKASANLSLDVKLVPVYFDGEVEIDFVDGASGPKRLPSGKMLGYVQLAPIGQPISAALFAELLMLQNGSLGGPVDSIVNIAASGQKMRINRADVNVSQDTGGKPIFASAVKGSVILPNDGSWSIVQHTKATDEVTPVTDNNSIPLIKEGLLSFDAESNPIYPTYDIGRFKIAPALELVKNANDAASSFAFLQNTDTQKVLFKNPEFQKGIDILLQNVQAKPKLADAYRLLNSPGIFPKLQDVLDMDLSAQDFEVKIKEEGYKLLNKLDIEKQFEQVIPEGPWFIVNEPKIKIYVEYAAKKADGTKTGDGTMKYDLDSAARRWVNKMNDITMVVDLLTFKRLLLIRGKFDTEKGKAPSFLGPELEFGPDLKPVVDILQLLAMLAVEPDYKEILEKGLKIAMSNSPESWEYKFQADKEIPVIKFPPAYLDGPTTPLRLEAGLKVGCYFNMALPLPPGSGITTPSAGAFIEFYGKLNVMCVSVAVGTVYAIGSVNLRLSADTKAGPILDMKFAFAAELMVGLPVIGNVSISFGAGVEIHLDSATVMVGAFIFFKGRAEILGGIVTVTIYIEASGKVLRSGNETNCIAQVTFALDISICFIIDISFEEHWQEEKQIA